MIFQLVSIFLNFALVCSVAKFNAENHYKLFIENTVNPKYFFYNGFDEKLFHLLSKPIIITSEGKVTEQLLFTGKEAARLMHCFYTERSEFIVDYKKILTQKVQDIKPSGIRRFFDLANQMDDVISLGIGEPDFPTPAHISNAGISSIQQGKTFYSPNRGFLELREQVSKYFSRRFNVEYDPKKEILMTAGGSEAIDACIRSVVAPGDEVIIPEPCFVCYDPLTRLAEGVPVTIQTKAEDGFRLTAEALRNAITPKTKLLILSYPNNPTGAVMRRENLEAIAEVLRGTDIMVLSDEIYAELTYGSERHVSFAAIDGMRERSVIVSGFSKAFSMTGWRLGYALGPADVIGAMTKIHQFGIMCASSVAQNAAIEAMKNGEDDIEAMRAEYDKRRNYIVNRCAELGMPCFAPEGAFYVFPDIRSFGLSSEDFCARLLNEFHVAIIPGSAFGAGGEGFARVSYSYSLDHIEKAFDRIAKFVSSLKK